MPFEIGPEELRAMARLEEEAGCDVEAGFDWGAETGDYLRHIQKKSAIAPEQQGEEKGQERSSGSVRATVICLGHGENDHGEFLAARRQDLRFLRRRCDRPTF